MALRGEIKKLKRWDNSQKTQVYVKAFDDFCKNFQTAKLSDRIATSEWLEFEFGEFRIGGKIDLLLEDWEGHQNLLLDLKLEKFGSGLFDLNFFDVLQIMLYAYELRHRDIEIQEVGYYYFKERTLLVHTLTTTELQQFHDVMQQLMASLKMTMEFMPRKCELCLICPLQKKCPVGQQLSKTDFENPLDQSLGLHP